MKKIKKTKPTEWCKCDLAKMGITPMRVHFEHHSCGSTFTCKVTKHHYHCSKCGGVTQIEGGHHGNL